MQTKIQKEIDEISKEEEVDYDRIDNSNYWDLFVRELLRMFPGSIQVISRECNQDTVVCGYNIRKVQCDVIQPDVYSLHYDRELWCLEDPQLFLLERHSTRQHPIAFMTVGQGPRN